MSQTKKTFYGRFDWFYFVFGGLLSVGSLLFLYVSWLCGFYHEFSMAVMVCCLCMGTGLLLSGLFRPKYQVCVTENGLVLNKKMLIWQDILRASEYNITQYGSWGNEPKYLNSFRELCLLTAENAQEWRLSNVWLHERDYETMLNLIREYIPISIIQRVEEID